MRAQIFQGRARIKDGKAVVGPDDACCCAECPDVCSTTIPDQMQVVIGGTSELAGTYVIDRVPGECYWRRSFQPGLPKCEGFGCVLELNTFTFAGKLSLLIGPQFGSCWYRESVSLPIDCAALDMDLTEFFGDVFCDSDNLTVHVSAL